MILCINNTPLLCLTEADDDEVFLERDQEVISPLSIANDNMDSRIGLDYIVENSDYVAKLAAALDTNNEIVKKQVFELLSALCAYSRSGYCRAIETLENYKVSVALRMQTAAFTHFILYFFTLRRISKMKDTASKWSSRNWTKQRPSTSKWRYWRSLIA